MLKRIKQVNRSGVKNVDRDLVSASIRDTNIIELPTKAQVSLLMSQLGRKGGKKGGKRRMATMTPEQRSQVALKAAQTRWSKRKKSSSQQ
jgi:hypothetical protein